MNITVNKSIQLTPFRATDKFELVMQISNKAIYDTTLAIPFPYTMEDAEKWLSRVMEFEAKNNIQKDWVIRNEADELIGAIGLLNGIKDAFKDEIGYWLAEPYWGQGIMTAVVESFTEYCFKERGLIRIQAHAFAHNVGSEKVLLKAGFNKEGTLKKNYLKDGLYFDGHLYAKIN